MVRLLLTHYRAWTTESRSKAASMSRKNSRRQSERQPPERQIVKKAVSALTGGWVVRLAEMTGNGNVSRERGSFV
jgi:hypothetical protein